MLFNYSFTQIQNLQSRPSASSLPLCGKRSSVGCAVGYEGHECTRDWAMFRNFEVKSTITNLILTKRPAF
jgi:hypothetical protein